MTKRINNSSILEGKKNKANDKVQRLKIFDANSTSGYGFYSVNNEGVLHGCMESFSGNAQTVESRAINTLISQMKKEAAAYAGTQVSSYEVMVYRAMSLLIAMKKNATIAHTVNIGCRAGKQKPMVADMVITKNKYKLLLEVQGGLSEDNHVNLWHDKYRSTCEYKENNYQALGFTAYYAVNFYDIASKRIPGTDLTQFTVYRTPNGKKIRVQILKKQALRREIIGIVNRLEIDKVMKFSNNSVLKAVDQTWNEMFDYLSKKRMARYQLTNI